ncbi:MAG: ACP synthase [Myxococcota bacterium]
MGAAVVLVDVARVERILGRHRVRFLGRVFSPEEREACAGARNESERLAARLAAKLAARRVLPEQFLPLRCVSVRGGAGDAPVLAIDPPPPGKAFVSLAHDGGVAAAAVVLEPDPKGSQP